MASNNEKDFLISFRSVIKSFKHHTILYELNLDISEGEVIGLVGKSGCGKSTLLKILIGLYPPDSGQVLFRGQNITRNYKSIRQIAGFVSQENSFYEKLTVEENLRFFSKLYNVNKRVVKGRIEHLLDLVNLKLARHTLASNISGGMKRRLEFAISMIHDPLILILDEPFTGLDMRIKNELWDVIKEIQKSGVTVIICSHLLESLGKNADRVVFLHNKRIFKDVDLKANRHVDIEKMFLEVTSK